jgi:predicted lipid-binding transport protein (Tim44 family)
MDRLFSAVFAVLFGFALGIAEAEAAKRIGGGRSVGVQRDSVQQQRTAPARPAQAPQTAPGAPQTPPVSPGAGRWLGPIAGLLAGGALGALLFGGTFDGFKFMDFAIILLLAAAVFYIFRMLSKPGPAQEHAGPLRYAGVGPEPRLEPEGGESQLQPLAVPQTSYFPAGFDPEAFAAQSKANFVRLQQANDRGDLGALREVMTAELFNEIQSQFNERGAIAQATEVVALDASVIEVVTEGANYIASVRFAGMIKEDHGQAEPFREIWHLQKPLDGSTGWLIAGIQQD